MQALVFDIRVNSLYSIRLPFTWQSALTYPTLPPSAVIGMLANALQRFKNDKHPLEYLDLIEENVLWAGSRLLTPCVIKSYTTSAVVKWADKLGGKFTNALGRQFAYAKKLQVLAIFKNDSLINETIAALKTTPLTCGDSESLISLESGEVLARNVRELQLPVVTTEYPILLKKDTNLPQGQGRIYLMHERCRRTGSNFPLISYMIPVKEMHQILYPASLTVQVSSETTLEIEGIGNIITNVKG